jgi:hypothetical protein
METCKTKKREGKEQHIFLAFCFSGFDYKATHARTHTHTHTHERTPLLSLQQEQGCPHKKSMRCTFISFCDRRRHSIFQHPHTHPILFPVLIAARDEHAPAPPPPPPVQSTRRRARRTCTSSCSPCSTPPTTGFSARSSARAATPKAEV